MSKVVSSIILPTYNEADNIPILIKKIGNVLPKGSYEILVVDDNSPDGTWKIAREISSINPHVHSIRRLKNRGLSSAVLDGYAAACGDFLIVMDADLQHDEKILPDIIQKLQDGADIVIGSRKVKGGGIDGWSKWRQFISWGATLLAHILIGTKVTDPMSGYYGITKGLFEEYGQKVNPRGFKILLEFVARAKKHTIVEVGFVFKPRIHGESKLTTSVILEYLNALYDLSLGRVIPLEFIKYGVVGASGVIVNLSILHVCHSILDFGKDISLIAAIETSLITNFVLNNLWTFKTKKLKGIVPFLKGFFTFHVICLIGALINFSVAKYTHSLLNINLYVADLIGIAVATVWNYMINIQVTWTKNSI